jgi:hypothetical protein
VFHVELRQFPHNACRFNLNESELLALVEPWAGGQWIEMGERKWSPHQARLTVLSGPRLSAQELSMSRGWRNAVRRSEEVTEQVLARAGGSDAETAAAGVGPSTAPQDEAPATGPTVERPDGSLDAAVAPLLGADPQALLAAWQLVAGRRPELSPSESLALAEDTLRSLGKSRR